MGVASEDTLTTNLQFFLPLLPLVLGHDGVLCLGEASLLGQFPLLLVQPHLSTLSVLLQHIPQLTGDLQSHDSHTAVT